MRTPMVFTAPAPEQPPNPRRRGDYLVPTAADVSRAGWRWRDALSQ
jgi:hypothetical protein